MLCINTRLYWPNRPQRTRRSSRSNRPHGSDRRHRSDRPHGAARFCRSERQERISGGGRGWVYRDRGATERGPGGIAERPVSPHRRRDNDGQHQHGQQHNKRPDGRHGLHYHTSARHIPRIDIARHPAEWVHSHRVLIRRRHADYYQIPGRQEL